MNNATRPRAIVAAARGNAPREFGPYRTRSFWSIAQLYTGNPDLHYEVWRRARLGTIELGLHFEADPLTNARLLAAFKARAKEIRKALGDVAIEGWDKGWARVYESLPLDTSAEHCATRLADYVRVLEPILRQELPDDVPWKPARRAARARARRR